MEKQGRSSEGGAWGTVPLGPWGPWPGMSLGTLLGQSARPRGGPGWVGGTGLGCPAFAPPLRVFTCHLLASCLTAPLHHPLASLCLSRCFLVSLLLSSCIAPQAEGGGHTETPALRQAPCPSSPDQGPEDG